MISYVYCLTNIVNGKQYIGKSIDPSNRWKAHLHAVPSGTQKLYRAMRKHGIDAFRLEIVSEYSSEEEAYAAEHALIVEKQTHIHGYNMNEGGEGSFKPNEEVLLKKSIALKGHVVSEETRRKISATRKLRKIPSPKMSEEGKQRIRAAHQGKKRDPRVGRRISARAKERRELGFKRNDGNNRKNMSKFEIREREMKHLLLEQADQTVVSLPQEAKETNDEIGADHCS